MTNRVALIEDRLRRSLAPIALDVIDDSPAHASHVEARGGGYFTVSITSAAFSGKTLLERHRLIYAALADLMNREIHALRIRKARTPDEP